jgi:hypothetical protein
MIGTFCFQLPFRKIGTVNSLVMNLLIPTGSEISLLLNSFEISLHVTVKEYNDEFHCCVLFVFQCKYF